MKFSVSSLSKFALCPRKYKLGYVEDYWPKGTNDVLRFGTIWHDGRERYWGGVEGPPDTSDLPSDEATVLEQMHRVYAELYDRDPITVNGVEEKHRLPFGDHTLTVVMDAHIAQDGHNAVVESKTTRSQIDTDWFWMKLELDHQISLYVWAANQIGLPTEYVIYDVVKVPPLKQGKDGRKKIPEETLAEFEERCYNELKKNNDKYFQRKLHKPNVPRAIKNVEQWLQFMQFAEDNDCYPMNPNSCKAFGKLCEYFGNCAEDRDLDDNPRITKGRKR